MHTSGNSNNPNAVDFAKIYDAFCRCMKQINEREYSSIRSDNYFALVRRQSINWTNDD